MNGCIFCQIVDGKIPASKVLESESALAFFDINPVAAYHTLVVPKKHFTNLFDVSAADLKETMELLRKVVALYREKLGLQDLQVLSNSGKYAQQEVFHLHFHIVPRQPGDGQNLRWKTFPELRHKFEEFLQRLK